MNTTETSVTNAANLSLFMVNLGHRLLQEFRPTHPEFSVLDLKAHCRGYKYVEETIKLLPEPPEPIVLKHMFATIAGLGGIHPVQPELVTT